MTPILCPWCMGPTSMVENQYVRDSDKLIVKCGRCEEYYEVKLTRLEVRLRAVEQKLKPCPFCGGGARVIPGMLGAYYVECARDECGAGVSDEDLKVAIEKWNQRVRE